MREAAIRGTVTVLGYAIGLLILWGLARGLWMVHDAYGTGALAGISLTVIAGCYLLARWLDIHHPRQPRP